MSCCGLQSSCLPELKLADHHVCVQVHTKNLTELQSQLDQAYHDLNELQFTSDQEKAQLEAQVKEVKQQLTVSSLQVL